eukprot:c21517_g1_i1 orf=162-2393(+)
MRKRPRHPPIFINTKKQASAAGDSSSSSSFSLCCFPLFYLLLITWIILFTLNPTPSHYTGSYSWSVPWLSGVHADEDNGEQKVRETGLSTDTQETALPLSESTQEFTISSRRQSSARKSACGPSSRAISVQDLKCRSPLLKDVFFLSSFPECCRSISASCKKRGRGHQNFHIGSNLACKDVCRHAGTTRKYVSSHAIEGSNESQFNSESQHLQDSTNKEGPLELLHVSRDVDDSKEHDTLEHLHEYGGTHIHINDEKEHQTSQQVKCNVHDLGKNGGEHYGNVYVNNGKLHHTDRLPPPDLNETKSAFAPSDILNKTHPALTNLSRIHLRQEPGDGPYNYASDSKGAKILASNKEAKGASNILNKDKDKYFRTPCNVETKFVDMELSEETLVVEIVIANHEFYSSNVREFELWGSLTYPAEKWVSLGKFEAENCRLSQTFALREPQWVRYLKIQMLSHYGSDFYCTLSMVEVYGVDAIEWLLEEWIAEESGGPGARALSIQEENSSIGDNKAGSPMLSRSQVLDKDASIEGDVDSILTQKLENALTDKAADVSDGKGKNMEKPQSVYHQTGRPAIDAVMKLLMQKVRSLEHNQPLLSRYLQDVDERYREVLQAYSKELTMMTGKLEGVSTEVANLNAWLQFMEGQWNQEKLSLEKDILDQVKAWNADLSFIRNELRRTENKELVALAVSFFSILTVVSIQALMLCVSLFKPGKQNRILQLSSSWTLWAVPFWSCVFVVVVLSL